ncbi:hypothetical protein [Nocardia sp. XZ_19_385]|uniref:hypothetical protein n=1 Tax=Nocardia sp. XZ_19_385 TaxID=2769488 RepID=UPI00188E348D|nr:hypothetical protein [Nocardia sp. XZ_19_385]
MAARDITVTVSMDDDQWHSLADAAECAGMTLEAYLCWGVRLMAAQARPGKNLTGGHRTPITAPRKGVQGVEEPDSAWTETFTERLSHRAEQYREV